MRVADWIFQRLEREVDTVFYLPGGGSGVLVDALGQSNLKAVCCSHEQGAGYAAIGYSQYRGLGVCLVTSGPGGTNAVTPCLAAWMDSVAVLFISGQVYMNQLAKPGMRSMGPQEARITDIVRPITKMAQIARGQNSTQYWIEYAIFSAKNKRRGPSWVDVPLDVQGEEVKVED